MKYDLYVKFEEFYKECDKMGKSLYEFRKKQSDFQIEIENRLNEIEDELIDIDDIVDEDRRKKLEKEQDALDDLLSELEDYEFDVKEMAAQFYNLGCKVYDTKMEG